MPVGLFFFFVVFFCFTALIFFLKMLPPVRFNSDGFLFQLRLWKKAFLEFKGEWGHTQVLWKLFLVFVLFFLLVSSHVTLRWFEINPVNPDPGCPLPAPEADQGSGFLGFVDGAELWSCDV